MLKTHAYVTETGLPSLFDTVEYNGKWWILNKWLVYNDIKQKMPERILSLESLNAQAIDTGNPFDFQCPLPLSLEFFSCPLFVLAEKGIEALDRPNLSFPLHCE